MSNEARQAEIKGTAEFEFRGQKFSVPTDYADWPLELHEALEDGKNIAVLRAALGPDQWGRVRAMGLKTPDIDDLASAAVGALGFRSTGESPASSD